MQPDPQFPQFPWTVGGDSIARGGRHSRAKRDSLFERTTRRVAAGPSRRGVVPEGFVLECQEKLFHITAESGEEFSGFGGVRIKSQCIAELGLYGTFHLE